jgi:hypothetical protein
MSQYNFGIGSVTLVPAGATPTPVQVAVISDIQVDFSFDVKELRGQNQFPVDIARGNGKISGKAKNASIAGGLILAALGQGAVSTGTNTGVSGEAGVIPATPYQVTVANSATWVEDLGVVNLTSGKIMTRVASSPATGQYSVAAGIYTFAAADTTNNVQISYTFSTAGSGKTTVLSNSTMGGVAIAQYSLSLRNNYGGQSFGVDFPAVIIPKMSFVFKSEAYTEQDLDFSVFQSPTSSVIATLYTKE